MRKQRRESSETSVQGRLLWDRRDFSGLRISFKVELPQTHLATMRKQAPARLGIKVSTNDEDEVLTVENVLENGNWDTPVIQHNQEQRWLMQPHNTVQPGDLLVAVNEQVTGHSMLKELQKTTRPFETSELNLQVERELRDLLEPFQERSTSGSPERTNREPKKMRSTRSPRMRAKCRSTGSLMGSAWRRHSAGWPHLKAPKLCKGIASRHAEHGPVQSTPSGNLSSMAWEKVHSLPAEAWTSRPSSSSNPRRKEAWTSQPRKPQTR